MSAYIVSDETINAIANAFVLFRVQYCAENYSPTDLEIILANEQVNAIGRSLLEQNYKSVNYRYGEDDKAPVFKGCRKDYDLGEIYGSLRCYNYQACETDDYFESELYRSIQRLEDEITRRAIEELGYGIPWGLD